MPDIVDNLSAVLSTLGSTSRSVCEVLGKDDAGAVNAACHDTLQKCRTLFNAEASAIFFRRGQEMLLEAQIGYDHPGGFPITFDTLRQHLRYKIGPIGVDSAGNNVYDGATGRVASTGEEYAAESWDEIKQDSSHAGKPDRLEIWSEKRPFRCLFTVPLTLGNETIGVLKVENKRDPHKRGESFDDVDKALLHRLAQVFCQKLEEAGFHEQLLYRTASTDLKILAQKFDYFKMGKVLKEVPRQIEVALKDDLPPLPQGPFSGAVIIGMGGSTLPADVLTSAFQNLFNAPIRIVRDYELPTSVADNHLIIASSFSGTTEETLAAIEQLSGQAKNVVCVTTGGRLRELAMQRGYPLVLLNTKNEPAGFQPRSATGYFVSYFARILFAAGIMADATADLSTVPRFLRSIDVNSDAECTARWLQDKIPIIYCDERYNLAIGRSTKIKFNENSKTPAFYNALPEANHNEMIGFSSPIGRFGILYLHDPSSHSQVRRRFEVMEKLFAEGRLAHVDFQKWDLPGETPIQKIFAALAFADMCSYDLALLNGLDPTPVDMVEKFKSELVT